MTSLRSFLMFYLPLLEPDMSTEEDDDDFPQDSPEQRRLDLVVPFKKSVKQIVREVNLFNFRYLWSSQFAFFHKFPAISLLTPLSMNSIPLELGIIIFISYNSKTL